MKNRILAIILAAVMLFGMIITPAAAVPASGLSVSADTVKNGETVTLTVTIPGTDLLISNILMKVNLNDGFEVTAFTAPAIEGMSLMQTTVNDANKEGYVSVSYSSISYDADVAFTSGLKLEITLKAKDGAVAGSYEFQLDSSSRVAGLDEMGMPLEVVDYSSFTDKSVSVAIEAEPVVVVLDSIAVTKDPAKTEYIEGEKFDPADMVVTATYSDTTKKEVTGYTYSPAQELKTTDTTITVSYTEGDVTKTAEVTIVVNPKPPVPAESIELDKDTLEVKLGKTGVLTATVKPDDTTDTVEWESSDPEVATVEDGTVTGVKEGTATITATAGEKSATCTVTVVEAKESEFAGEPAWDIVDPEHVYAVFTSTKDPIKKVTIPAAVLSDVLVEPTAYTPGKVEYTAIVTGPDGITYSTTWTAIIPATGSYSKPVDPKLPTSIPPVKANPAGDPRPTNDPVIVIPGQQKPAVPAVTEVPAIVEEKAVPFVDVNLTDSFYDDVKFVYENGIMNGISATEFAPYSTLTRGMIVTILYRLEGEPAVAFNGVFTDVEPGLWYSEAVEWAAENGIVKGYGDGTFGPVDAVTLEQLAAIMERYAGFKGYPLAEGAAVTGTTSEWAEANVAWAVETGVLAEAGDYTAAAIRAEVAHAIHAFCLNVVK